jgi:hypothetical protein
MCVRACICVCVCVREASGSGGTSHLNLDNGLNKDATPEAFQVVAHSLALTHTTSWEYELHSLAGLKILSSYHTPFNTPRNLHEKKFQAQPQPAPL